MINKVLPILWLIIGIAEFYIGITGYLRYSSGGLFLFIVPEEIEMKNMVFGLIFITTSILLFSNPKKAIKPINSFPVWIILYTIIGMIIYAIEFQSFGIEYLIIPDYLYVILSIFAIKELKKELSIKIKPFSKKQLSFSILSGIIINSLIYGLANIFTYDFFYL